MTSHEQTGEPNLGQPDQQPTELYDARSALVETVAEHTRALLHHEHPFIQIAAELMETGQIKPPYPTGDGSTLPPKLREYVRRSLVEEALREIRHGTPQPPETS
jgi:hypothetical protein